MRAGEAWELQRLLAPIGSEDAVSQLCLHGNSPAMHFVLREVVQRHEHLSGEKKKTAHEEGTWPSQSNPPSCATWFSSIAWPQGGSPLLNAAPGGSSAARALSRNVKNMLKA